MVIASQVLAVIIFLGMFAFIIADKIERHVVTLVSGLLMLVIVMGICLRDPSKIIDTLNLHSLITPTFWVGASEESFGINWATIIFIAGMTIMVEGMGYAGFFRWLCLRLAKLVKYKTVPLFLCFIVISAILSMFIDSITVIMFLAAVTIELAKVLKFDPIPMVLAEIFCANLGGSATMCGDPPNIIIGTALHYTFFDFLTNTGLIVLVCLLFIVPYYYLITRKALKKSEENRPKDIVYPDPKGAITNKKAFIMSAITFLIVVVLLVTHGATELSVATIGVIASVLTILSILISSGLGAVKKVMKKVDYKTLLFFTGLFVVVCGLEVTGILEIIAGGIDKLSGGNSVVMIVIILWISAIASAFIDNIPFAATMVPVIQSMAAATGVPLATLAWTLALGTDIGGNATPIGASANVVGTSIATKNGYPITWGRYCKYNAPATIIALVVSMVMLYIRYI